ncbi:hypothetical protein M0657_010075 [Pyricularia oryzae]|nr:hypothetical protein M9X92_010061 [Pyricularia oryzae]KAI7913303.1 hypothetical protein M0657_010075 [Pyricularia oryzae]
MAARNSPLLSGVCRPVLSEMPRRPRFDARVWKRRQQPVSKTRQRSPGPSLPVVRGARRPEDGGPPVPPFTGFDFKKTKRLVAGKKTPRRWRPWKCFDAVTDSLTLRTPSGSALWDATAIRSLPFCAGEASFSDGAGLVFLVV